MPVVAMAVTMAVRPRGRTVIRLVTQVVALARYTGLAERIPIAHANTQIGGRSVLRRNASTVGGRQTPGGTFRCRVGFR